jgi:hypothetical protein
MNVKPYIAAAALALAPMLSQASVVYEWESTNNETPRGVTFRLEFEESTVQSGSFSFDSEGKGDLSAWLPPGLGLISFSFAAPGGAFIDFTRDVRPEPVDDRAGYLDYTNYLNMSVSLGEYLEGYISAGNYHTGVSMGSNNGVFEIYNLETDAPLDQVGCGPSAFRTCYGATGVIRQVADVPEPGSLALFGGGLFAAWRLRRKAIP